jgi:transcriptional regulator of acetoin/glycerol metabolism
VGEGELDEGKRLERVLARHNGVVAHAAAELGLSRQALYRRLRRHGLELERRVKPEDAA